MHAKRYSGVSFPTAPIRSMLFALLQKARSVDCQRYCSVRRILYVELALDSTDWFSSRRTRKIGHAGKRSRWDFCDDAYRNCWVLHWNVSRPTCRSLPGGSVRRIHHVASRSMHTAWHLPFLQATPSGLAEPSETKSCELCSLSGSPVILCLKIVSARARRFAEHQSHRTRVKVPLGLIALPTLQEAKLFVCFHTFRHDANCKSVRHGDDRSHHGGCVRISTCLLHEALINL